MQKFEETLDTLRNVRDELRDRGVVVEHLDKAINQLNRHHENIIKIENNIEAIQEEVIEPVKTELEFNKVSGKFSIFGFWIGTAGLIVSLFTGATAAISNISNLRSNKTIVRTVENVAERSNMSFFCDIVDDTPTTFANSLRGRIAFISWQSEYFSSSGENPARRCLETSSLFRLADEKGMLNYPKIDENNGENFICTSKEKDDSCDIKLFRLRPDQDPNRILQQFLELRDGVPRGPLIL